MFVENLEIHLMQLSDICVVAKLWHDGWHEAHASFVPEQEVARRTLKKFQQRLEDYPNLGRIAVLDDQPVGLCVVENDELAQLFVVKTARRIGVASALLLDGEKRIAASSFQKTWLTVLSGNDRAQAFYQKRGWVYDKIVPLNIKTGSKVSELQLLRFEKHLL